MTNQEAIEVIKLAQAQVEWEYPMDYATAFDMATSALQEQELQPTCNELATDTISRQAAIDELKRISFSHWFECGEYLSEDTREIKIINSNKALEAIEALPSAQPEQSTEIQEILDYLDNTLHPIVSPDNWNVYAELHDMVSELLSAQPEQRWILCSERLPKANGRYLVTRGLNACGAMWNRVYIINYSDLMGLKSERIWWDGNVGKSDFERIDDVIAWMPLPEPCRAERRTDA